MSASPEPSYRAIGTGDLTATVIPTSSGTTLTDKPQSGRWNGTNVIGGGNVGASPGPSWNAIGTGDFNGDGHADVLWQNPDGQVAIWEMNGTNVIGGGTVISNPGPSWHVVGASDFNDDGHSDVLFQNAISGQVAVSDVNARNVSIVFGGGTISRRSWAELEGGWADLTRQSQVRAPTGPAPDVPALLGIS